ncbi:hypothetical protein GCM10007049_24310 [Echinicola pacifica]|uniref:Glucokinase n=1 Tax=Echinicola pacifica TaxID=346377 RepID=A0A918US68_9BACT|nr:ROK family protein [Echinicola pacifica]GGZ30606.1 hypothetical protein GCM10007049_24310 [Echinicola pacifica]
MTEQKVVGVDIGGSHITAGVVDLHNQTLMEGTLIRRKVDSTAKAEEILKAWSDCISDIPGYHPSICKIGIAMPGPFDYVEGISLLKDQGKYASLYGMNIKEELARALQTSTCCIHFENDAACFLQGEVSAGAARPYQKAIGLTLGTGLGSARFHGDFAEDAALWCSPFRGTIAEEYVSTRWFRDQYSAKAGKKIKDVRSLADLSATDALAKDIFHEFGENLGEFLCNFIKNDQPEVIVLGGNISKAEGLFMPSLQEYLLKNGHSTPIAITQLGEQAALIGAAYSWEYNQKAI